MSLAFDCPSAFESYDWEAVADYEWKDCFENMVSQSKDSLSGESSYSTSEYDEIEEITTNLNPKISLKVKRVKLMQLVLLYEVWARTGTDREAFYKYLALLRTPSPLDPNLLSPDLYNTLNGIKKLLGNDNEIHKISKDGEEKKIISWYDIIEKTVERLPSNIPVMMTCDSPLFNLLSVLEQSVSVGVKGKQNQVSSKLSALLKQSRFLTDFTPIGFIGKGGFGTVLKAEKKSEDLSYAIKVIRFRDFAVPSKRFQRVFREVTTLARLDHVNVVRYYSAWLELTEEYNDMLSGLNPPSKDGNETPSDDEEESYFDSDDEFGIEDYLEDDMSSMSLMMPVNGDDYDSMAEPASHCMLTLGDEEEKMYIYGGGSVEVGFKGKKVTRRCKSSGTVFEQPKLWRANSSRSILPVNPLKRSIPSTRNLLRRSYKHKPRGIQCEPVSVSSTSHSLITAKQFDYTLFIQMQLYEHATLKQWLINPSRVIDKKENLIIFKQIISGLQHVHQHGLLHRDLKPANIFLSKNGTIKIGDFGLSRDLQITNKEEDSTTYSKVSKKNPFLFGSGSGESQQTFSVGTPGYVAPEILNNDIYGPKIDVYSLGIILMELFTKTTTKHERGKNLMQLRDRIVPKSIAEQYPDIATLILSMTEPIPKIRIGLDELATTIDIELDDTEALRKQINEQQHIIKEQTTQIAILIEENNRLKRELLLK